MLNCMKQMEIVQKINAAEKRACFPVYPERMFSRVDKDIEQLRKIERGEIEILKLNDKQRAEALSFESGLCDELEKIYDKEIKSVSFCLDYFLTGQGRDDFAAVLGFDVAGDTLQELESFLFRHRKSLAQADRESVLEFAGRSRAFVDERIFKDLANGKTPDGELSIEGVQNPHMFTNIVNPDEALEKIQRLRRLKRLVALGAEAKNENGQEVDPVQIAKRKIREVYRKKLNTMIVSEAHASHWAFKMQGVLSEEELTPEEWKLARQFAGMQMFEKTKSRLDRFIHGADMEYDHSGARRKIGRELDRYIALIESVYIKGEFEMEQHIRERGLDPEKIQRPDIDVSRFSQWMDDYLNAYGEKSVYPPASYDPGRTGLAPDGKWQFLARDRYKSMSVNAKHKIIKSGTKDKSIVEVLARLLGHEGTHFIQALNKSKMPFRLFERIGGDRAAVFAEGGAMMIQDQITREFFGYANSPHPHYLRAMKRRLEGGTYLECIKAFYDSELKNLQLKKEKEIITEESFVKRTEELLQLAINRSKRLFSNNEDYGSGGEYLTKSKDTVYAEQVIVMQKLKENGMEKYAFISGINLDTLVMLAEMGFLKLDDIAMPNIDFIRKIWAHEKNKYELQPQVLEFPLGVERIPASSLSLD